MAEPIDLEELIAEVRSEIGYRRRVYSRLVAEGKKNKAQANRQIDRMETIQNILFRIKADPSIMPEVLRERVTLFNRET